MQRSVPEIDNYLKRAEEKKANIIAMINGDSFQINQ